MKARLASTACLLVAWAATSACTSDAEKAYAHCVERTAAAVSDEVDPGLSPEIAEGFREANLAIAEKTCRVVKRQCEKDPESDLCRSMLERYQ